MFVLSVFKKRMGLFLALPMVFLMAGLVAAEQADMVDAESAAVVSPPSPDVASVVPEELANAAATTNVIADVIVETSSPELTPEDQASQDPVKSSPASELPVAAESENSTSESASGIATEVADPQVVGVTTEGSEEPKVGIEGFIKDLVASDEPEPAQPALNLLGKTVEPSTTARLSWKPRDNFMGISAPTPVLVANGAHPGPTLCMSAAIHGDELNGIEIVRDVFYSIDPAELHGAVIGVPIVNMQGFRRASRYLADRRDLNRYFPGRPNGSSASRIASSYFEEVIRNCDYLVDLHTGSFGRTNLPQLRADLTNERVAQLAEKMGNIVVLHSDGVGGSLRSAAVEAGIPAVTLEAGEPHVLRKDVIEQGAKSVRTLIHALEMAKTLNFWEIRTAPVYYKSRWVRSVSGGILFSDVELGKTVEQGEILGVISDPITNAKTEIKSPYDGRVIGMALNQVMYPGYAAYHIGLRTPVEAAVEEVEPELESEIDPEAAYPSPDITDAEELPLVPDIDSESPFNSSAPNFEAEEED